MSKLPDANPTLTAYLVRQKRQAERQASSSAFARSGTRVSAEGVTTVDGELIVDGSETVNGTLDVAGTLDVTGDTVIGGTLSLPNGIVDNAALASPVKPQAVYFSAQGFALSTGGATLASSTITVPAGFTSAVVSVAGRVFATNPTVGADYLSAVARIDGLEGYWLPLLVGGSGGSNINVSPYSRVLSGLTGGGTFVLAVLGSVTYANWAYNGGNTAEVSGSILWFR